MENSNISEALKRALDMEEKGYTFYKEMSEKSQSDITKKTFNFLADSEILHLETIKEFCDALVQKGEFLSIDLSEKKGERDEGLKIFSKEISELKEKIRPGDDDIKACEFAMEFEKEGYEFYTKMLNDVEDKNLVKFLKFIVDEEKAHYDGLEKFHSYLGDSANWFMDEEGSFPQG
ncbi:ferritin family protein [Candidatus Omnitrophota bacterium]